MTDNNDPYELWSEVIRITYVREEIIHEDMLVGYRWHDRDWPDGCSCDWCALSGREIS